MRGSSLEPDLDRLFFSGIGDTDLNVSLEPDLPERAVSLPSAETDRSSLLSRDLLRSLFSRLLLRSPLLRLVFSIAESRLSLLFDLRSTDRDDLFRWWRLDPDLDLERLREDDLAREKDLLRPPR